MKELGKQMLFAAIAAAIVCAGHYVASIGKNDPAE